MVSLSFGDIEKYLCHGCANALAEGWHAVPVCQSCAERSGYRITQAIHVPAPVRQAFKDLWRDAAKCRDCQRWGACTRHPVGQ